MADVLGRPAGYVVPAEERLPITTDWSGMDDFYHCPPDYGTWWEQYASYTRGMVIKNTAVMSWNVDEIVSEICTRFIERDSLGVFSNGWETRSESGKSNFRSYYSSFVVAYVPGKNRNIVRRQAREQVIADAPIGGPGEDEVTLLDRVSAPAAGEPGDWVDFEDAVHALRASASPELAETIDVVVAAALDGSTKLRAADIARALGIGHRTASVRLEAVRELAGALV